MKLEKWSGSIGLTLVAALWIEPGAANSVQAQTNTNVDPQILLQRIDELEQKVKILERNRELDQEATKEVAAEKAKTTPTVSLGANGLLVRSADSNFTLNIHGFAQVDSRSYLNDSLANNTFLLRRVRPIFEGTVFNRFDYRLQLDLASGVNSPGSNNDGFITDAYVNARAWPELQIQVGKYKAPVSLERLQSTANLPMVETGFPTEMTPNYDLGAMVHNGLFRNVVDYEAGVFNGVPDGASGDIESFDGNKELVARLFAQPFLNTGITPLRGLGFGVGGSYGRRQGPARPYVTPGQQTFFSYAANVTHSGEQSRIDPQAYYYWGPFGVLGEYILSEQRMARAAGGSNTVGRFDNRGWQVIGSLFLTGEQNSFKQVVPLHPLGITGGGWGALELVGRVGELRLDEDIFPLFATATSAHKATEWGVGFNWHLNHNVKLQVDYEHTYFGNGVAGANSVTARDEDVILGRVQFAF